MSELIDRHSWSEYDRKFETLFLDSNFKTKQKQKPMIIDENTVSIINELRFTPCIGCSKYTIYTKLQKERRVTTLLHTLYS